MFNDRIKVDFKVFATRFSIQKQLDKMSSIPALSFDTETQSKYSKEDKEEARNLLKKSIDDLSPEDIRHCKLAIRSSGLSYPDIVKITHFQFGFNDHESVVFIAYDEVTEKMICDWVAEYKGKLLIYNTLFDLKLIYHRTGGKLPLDIEDTQLLARTLVNDADDFQCRTGLKVLAG